MELLKKKFTSRLNKHETVDSYLNLIYGEKENDNDEIIDNDMPAAGTCQ